MKSTICKLLLYLRNVFREAQILTPWPNSESVKKMNNQNENAPEKEQKKKRAAVSPFWTVLNRARKTFDVQLVKNNETKLNCLKKYSGAEYDDQQKFHGAYMEKVERLTDSVRYCKAAEAAKCDPTVLATHIVFLGSATMNKVLKLGLENAGILRDIELYKEPFLPDAQAYAKIQ